MHLRIPAVLCCAILAGFAAATQNGLDKSYYEGAPIDIDEDLEGSGGGTEVSRDLESSGSGFGPDDEDSQDNRGPNGDIPRKVDPTITPRVILPDVAIKPTKEDDSHSGSTFDTDNGISMNPKPEERHTSFFAQPGILAAVIGGAVVGLLCAILVVMFIVYRMRKKDEGSYPLDEPKRSPTSNSYNRGGNSKEFFA